MSKLTKYGVLILVAYFLMEATSFMFFSIIRNEIFSFRKVRQHQKEIIAKVSIP